MFIKEHKFKNRHNSRIYTFMNEKMLLELAVANKFPINDFMLWVEAVAPKNPWIDAFLRHVKNSDPYRLKFKDPYGSKHHNYSHDEPNIFDYMRHYAADYGKKGAIIGGVGGLFGGNPWFGAGFGGAAGGLYGGAKGAWDYTKKNYYDPFKQWWSSWKKNPENEDQNECFEQMLFIFGPEITQKIVTEWGNITEIEDKSLNFAKWLENK